jgi:hypothetical protein
MYTKYVFTINMHPPGGVHAYNPHGAQGDREHI